MTNSPRILVFSGSTRQGSWNSKLSQAGAIYLKEAGANVTSINLADFDLPIYNGDLEESDGMPDGAREFKKLLDSHHGFMISSPEYNGFFTPILKNAIDWASRPHGDDTPLVPFKGKTAALIATSPGANGGFRGLPHLRLLLSGLGVLVISEQYALRHGSKAFAEDGALSDETAIKNLQKVSESLVRITKALAV